jgi:hypothetical protein
MDIESNINHDDKILIENKNKHIRLNRNKHVRQKANEEVNEEITEKEKDEVKEKLPFDLEPPKLKSKKKIKKFQPMTEHEDKLLNELFTIKTPIKNPKQDKESENEKNEKDDIIEMICRYHDVFGKQHKPNPQFIGYEKMEKKSLSALKNYLIKYQDKINGNIFQEKLTDYSLIGIRVYEDTVTKLSRSRINLNNPNRVSDIMKDNPEYDTVIKEIYCQYCPSLKIKNPLLKLASMIVLSSAVVSEQNRQSQQKQQSNITIDKIEELPLPIPDNSKEIPKITMPIPEIKTSENIQKEKDEKFIQDFQSKLIK